VEELRALGFSSADPFEAMVTAVRVTVLKKRAALEKDQKPAKKSKERPAGRPAAALRSELDGPPGSRRRRGTDAARRGSGEFPVKTRRYLLTDGLKRANLLGSMYVRVHRTPASAKLPKHAVVEECADLR
jgi:hypothetical protein